MVWKKILIINLISCCFSSCLNYYHHPDGGYRPKKSKFYLQAKPYKITPNNRLKTDVLYFSNDTLKYGNGNYNDLFYYRFFSNGRFYKSAIDVKDITNLNKLNKPVFIGYYTIKNKLIELEYFFVKHREKGEYIKDTLYIKNDTLYPINPNHKSNKKEIKFYSSKKIKGLKKITDW
ncbi:hypothetical protein [Tenacibaculum ovolyticum]|uniref:hypothetical protein n=1 Tax=Tenacibaculum ovolyticum TaxID=104270 RepID=UPI0007EC4868|nr:hypothetical protein [Tenacibaculum ovolyticum]